MALARRQPHRVLTITAENGTEISGYRVSEQAPETRFYFVAPYHA